MRIRVDLISRQSGIDARCFVFWPRYEVSEKNVVQVARGGFATEKKII